MTFGIMTLKIIIFSFMKITKPTFSITIVCKNVFNIMINIIISIMTHSITALSKAIRNARLSITIKNGTVIIIMLDA
jgi:hypothetical protein